jgi:hypothetical protein
MTLEALPDPLSALAAFLRQQIGDRLAVTPGNLKNIPPGVPAVFRPDLPQGFDAVMPCAAVVVRAAGGYTQFGRSQFYIGDPRVEIIAYGTVQQEATEVCRAAVVACKQLVAQKWENTLLYSAQVSAGPVPLPDAQTLWPACWASVQLIHGELPLAAA